MKELQNLADFVANFKLGDVSQEVVQAANERVLDNVASAVGAARDELFLDIAKTYYALQDDSKGRARVWGQGKKTSMLNAIFLNGLMGHVLETDDVHKAAKSHIGAVVIPAAWGVAEYLGSSPKEFLEAVICGYEVFIRVGAAIGAMGHRNRGWHATGTIGVFGSAAAAAKLLKLDAEKTIYAFGIAGTQSSGLWAFLKDGATNKILHIARAATNGVDAAFLAKSGMTGSRYILDAEDGGLFPSTSDKYDLSAVDKEIGKTYEILRCDTKPYPSCRSSHPPVDAALIFNKREKLKPEEIESIKIGTFQLGYKQVGASEVSKHPQKPFDARFSAPYAVACAFIDGKFTLKELEPAVILDPKHQALTDKISVYEDDKFTQKYPKEWGCELTVKTVDGRILTQVVDNPSGSVFFPMTQEQLKDKSAGLFTRVLDQSKAEKLINDLLNFDKLASIPEI